MSYGVIYLTQHNISERKNKVIKEKYLKFLEKNIVFTFVLLFFKLLTF